MTVRSEYIPFVGGLDLISSSVASRPGRLADALNFECVFGAQGYRRIDGYERFDGRAQPHKAQYQSVPFTDGKAGLVVDAAIFGAGCEGVILEVVVTSGSLASGNAVGTLIFAPVSGAFIPGDSIKSPTIGGATVAVTTAASAAASTASAQTNLIYARKSQAARRAKIEKLPGSGPVRGVAVFRGEVIAFRDAADGKTCVMHRATTAGWAQVKGGLLPGGQYEFTTGNFSGDASKMALFGCDGKNPPFKWDGTALTQMAPIFGTEATSTSSLSVGTGSKSFVIVQSSRGWVVGDTLLAVGPGGETMLGNITAYTHPNVTINVTSASGTGTVASWRIGQDDFEDRPYLIAAHQDHLFLAFRRGQLQVSNLGDPMTYTTTASLMGVGDEITGLTPLKGGVMGVFCDNKIHMLNGTNKADWQLSLHARDVGSKIYTVRESGGNAIMLSLRGLVSLQATQTFGGFEPSTWSRNVKPYLDGRMEQALFSRMASVKYQYRLYFKDGEVLSACITSPNPALQPKDVEFTRSRLAHVPSCLGAGQMDGEEAMFFGTEDGWVMREDAGQSFDGASIYAHARLHFMNLKSPSHRKRFLKLVLEADSPGQVTLKFLQLFDLSDMFYDKSITSQVDAPGAGGTWDTSRWDNFYWSLPAATQAEAKLDGIGRNMGILLWTESDIDEPITMQGAILHYGLMGMTR